MSCTAPGLPSAAQTHPLCGGRAWTEKAKSAKTSAMLAGIQVCLSNLRTLLLDAAVCVNCPSANWETCRAATAACPPTTAVQAIHYDADREVNALEGLEWAQFCDADKCGIKAGALSVGCYNPSNMQAQPVQQTHMDKLDCPSGQVVEVIYAHWGPDSVQGIDAITCRRALPTLSLPATSTCASWVMPPCHCCAHGLL